MPNEITEQRIDELKAALEKYGEHLSSCNKWFRGRPDGCTCGLEQALKKL